MSAMRDYVTPQERTDVFPIFNIQKKFVIEELKNIFYRRMIDDERQEKLERALHFLKEKRN
ncbi:MAG: hypothetical protein ACTHME_05135 [Candidatus Nitrosocosmicus sp.]